MFTCIFKGLAFRSLALDGRGACSALQRVSQFPRGTRAKNELLRNVKAKEKQVSLLTLVTAGRRQQPLFCLNTTSDNVHPWIWLKRLV